MITLYDILNAMTITIAAILTIAVCGYIIMLLANYLAAAPTPLNNIKFFIALLAISTILMTIAMIIGYTTIQVVALAGITL